jgi:hypothetical protein
MVRGESIQVLRTPKNSGLVVHKQKIGSINARPSKPLHPTRAYAERDRSEKTSRGVIPFTQDGDEFAAFNSHVISSTISKFRGLPFLSNAPIVPYSYG